VTSRLCRNSKQQNSWSATSHDVDCLKGVQPQQLNTGVKPAAMYGNRTRHSRLRSAQPQQRVKAICAALRCMHTLHLQRSASGTPDKACRNTDSAFPDYELLLLSATAATSQVGCVHHAFCMLTGTHRINVHAASRPGGLPTGRASDLATHDEVMLMNSKLYNCKYTVNSSRR
jgi:hypothetical protein